MRTKHPILGWVLSIALLVACQPVPTPDPPEQPDGGNQDAGVTVCIGTPAECACANLCELDCPECRPECVPSIEKIIADRIMDFDPECVTGARSKVAVRECPGVGCE